MSRHHSSRSARWPTGRQFALLFSLFTAIIFTLQNLEQMQFLREASGNVKLVQVSYDWSVGQIFCLAFWTLPVWVCAIATIGSRGVARTPLAWVCFLANLVLLATWGTGMVTAYRVANGH